MKQVLLMLAGLIFFNLCSAFTREDCADFLAENTGLLDAVSMTLSTQRAVFWTLHQPNFYGIITRNLASIVLRHKHEEILTTPIINAFQISRLVIFGYQLSDNHLIPGWLGYPAAWLYCQDHTYNGFDPFDACCIYDEKISRKRLMAPKHDNSDSGGNKKIHLMHETGSTFSLPLDCN